MGTIVTFYSYKGGTGRTLALANVAALLAQWGHKVLCVDWDLEAPGLHLYFERHAPPAKGGLVEVVSALAKGQKSPWQRFVVRTDVGALIGQKRTRKGKGRLDLLAAGRPGRGYVARLQSLDWAKLYEKGLGESIERLREEWSAAYDFVLLDSRTGITDIGGICTAQLPDILVLMATANDQSLDGIVDVAERARAARARMPLDKPVLHCLPVPSRFDVHMESAISAKWLQKFATRLEPYYRTWLHSAIAPSDILAHVKIPYTPVWSFGERLPVIEEGTADPESIGFALETLGALLAHKLAHSDVLVRNRDSFLAAARGARAEEDASRGQFGADVFVSHAAADGELAARLSRALKKRGLAVTRHERGGESALAREQSLRGAKNLLTIVGPEFGGWQLEETMSFLKMANAPSQRVVVLLTRDARPSDVPPLLRDAPVLDDRRPEGALVERLASVLGTHARPEDPQHGLWGRRAERGGRELTAKIRPVKKERDLYRIELIVARTKGAPPLRGTVRFHLHPSFKRHVREVEAQAGVATLSLLGPSAFTVGVEVDGGATVLELDLSRVRGVPKGFVEG
jgi:MinD-like ATPase involved in chromosome partitioning or flagellar assembly